MVVVSNYCELWQLTMQHKFIHHIQLSTIQAGIHYTYMYTHGPIFLSHYIHILCISQQQQSALYKYNNDTKVYKANKTLKMRATFK